MLAGARRFFTSKRWFLILNTALYSPEPDFSELRPCCFTMVIESRLKYQVCESAAPRRIAKLGCGVKRPCPAVRYGADCQNISWEEKAARRRLLIELRGLYTSTSDWCHRPRWCFNLELVVLRHDQASGFQSYLVVAQHELEPSSRFE